MNGDHGHLLSGPQFDATRQVPQDFDMWSGRWPDETTSEIYHGSDAELSPGDVIHTHYSRALFSGDAKQANPLHPDAEYPERVHSNFITTQANYAARHGKNVYRVALPKDAQVYRDEYSDGSRVMAPMQVVRKMTFAPPTGLPERGGDPGGWR